MKVVMDWDYPYLGKKYVLRRIRKLSIYFISRYIPYFRKYCEEIYQEHATWVKIYAELEKLTGKKMIYGIRPESNRQFRQLVKELEKTHDVRQHLHMWFKEDAEIFNKKYGYTPTEHAVTWIPKIGDKILVKPFDVPNVYLDFKTSEKDLPKLKDTMIVFHPDHKERSLLLYLKMLNRGKKNG